MDRAVTLDEINSSNPRHLSSDSLLAHDLVNADGHCPTDPLGVSGKTTTLLAKTNVVTSSCSCMCASCNVIH